MCRSRRQVIFLETSETKCSPDSCLQLWFHCIFCLPRSSEKQDIATLLDLRPENDGTRDKVSEKISERGEMSICITLGMILSRSIHTLDIKKKRETKQQQKRERQRLSEQSHGSSAHFQPSIQSGREYQHLGGYEHPGEEILRDSDHGDDGQNNSFAHRTVVPSPSQTFDWLDTEIIDSLEDTPPTYDHNAARLPPYNHGSFPRHGRRQGEGNHGEVSAARNGAQINEPRARACTGMRIRDHPGVDVNQGGAVIWYDALEDRYEVISRSLAAPTEPPLPPPYMPNRCVECLFTWLACNRRSQLLPAYEMRLYYSE